MFATPGSPRFNEICDMLHENSVMFSDTDILPDTTYTHVNNSCQTCSWHVLLFMFYCSTEHVHDMFRVYC